MKRHWIAAMAASMVMVFSSVCMATVPSDAIALSGIAPGSDVGTAKSILGEPSYAGRKLYFPNGIIIEVDKHNPNLVEEIETKASDGIATPSGVQVGMEEGVLRDIYGEPDKMDLDYDEHEYTYYSTDFLKKMKFEARNGIITEIKCEMR